MIESYKEWRFVKGNECRRFQVLESGDSLNGRNLFNECLFCRIPYQCLHSLNAWNPFSEKVLFFTDFCFVAFPSQKLHSDLSVPKIASQIAAFSNRKLQLLPQAPQKKRNEIANRCVSKSQIPYRSVFCLWDSKNRSKAPKLSELKIAAI